jgi:hypothetical protein
MHQNNQFTQKTNNLAILLKMLSVTVETETRYQDITMYENDVELEILNFQIKKQLIKEGMQESDIQLVTDFVNQFLSGE